MSDMADARTLNQGLLLELRNGEAGREKVANTINEDIVLTLLREDGIGRRLLPFEPVTPMQLSTDKDYPDVPVIFVPVAVQFNEYLATAVDFMQPSKDLWFRSSVAPVYFKPIKTKTIRLTETQLLANNYPIRTFVESVAKNDILAVEDIFLVNAFERCVASVGDDNDISSAAPFSKDALSEALKAVSRNRLMVQSVALHEATYADILRWNSSEVGSLVMQPIVEHGAKGDATSYKSWFGLVWATTNNSDVIPEGILYYLAPQKYLGVAKMLADAEQWLKFEDGILSTNTREIIGRSIMNRRGVLKQTLT